MKKHSVDKNNLLFSNKALVALLIPIVVEQLLNSFMGMIDTMMVSNVGSEALSGVSLVDSVNNLIVQLFSAMATGAAIVCSHYVGMRDKEGANNAAKQVVISVGVIALVITVFGIIFKSSLHIEVLPAPTKPSIPITIAYIHLVYIIHIKTKLSNKFCHFRDVPFFVTDIQSIFIAYNIYNV